MVNSEQIAFSESEIITILSTILTKYITQARIERDNRQQQRDEENETETTTTNKSTTNDVQFPLFMPYSTLQYQFYEYTGHGWTSHHLMHFGTLKLFLIKHPSIFLFHLPSERVGLVELFPNKDTLLINGNENINNGQFDPNDPERYCYNNDIWLTTSLHLNTYNEPNPTIQEQIEFQQLLYQNSHSSTRGKVIAPPLALDQSSLSSTTYTNRAQSLTSTPLTNDNITLPTPPTQNHLQTKSIKRQGQQQQQRIHNGFDQHDIDEKLKNRGCAPKAQTSLKLPIYFFLFLFIITISFGVLLQHEIILPDQIAIPNTTFHRSIVSFQRFIHDILFDLGFNK